MRVLLVGGGGREHALAWKLAQSPALTQLVAAPGNPGIARLAKTVPIDVKDTAGLVRLAQAERVDLVVVGPEGPLAAGLIEELARRGIAGFGPTSGAAAVESSKSFAKGLMKRAGVPTAPYREFTEFSEAQDYLAWCPMPVVIKADGLAAGKGVFVCTSRDEALHWTRLLLVEHMLGTAGHKLLVEDYLPGKELSVLAITDGHKLLPLLAAQDHKRLQDGDMGPNTGGMGGYAPVPFAKPALMRSLCEEILQPTINVLAKLGCPYRGLLYAGLMVTDSGPKVLEFNCRFGDPETQVILPLIDGDLLPVLAAAARGDLGGLSLSWREGSALCVVLTAEGYPHAPRRGDVIHGLQEAEAVEGVTVFHAGTGARNGRTVTDGGRVLAVTAYGQDLPSARAAAYRAAECIQFPGRYYRRDIGRQGLNQA